uniref:Heat shock 70 kDa protein n=1 Tax=Lygus hesperus TaxID=30085 RepID=A0A0A9XZJ5_LYGHE
MHQLGIEYNSEIRAGVVGEAELAVARSKMRASGGIDSIRVGGSDTSAGVARNSGIVGGEELGYDIECATREEAVQPLAIVVGATAGRTRDGSFTTVHTNQRWTDTGERKYKPAVQATPNAVRAGTHAIENTHRRYRSVPHSIVWIESQ